jgi:hypothetical protein
MLNRLTESNTPALLAVPFTAIAVSGFLFFRKLAAGAANMKHTTTSSNSGKINNLDLGILDLGIGKYVLS